MLTSPQQTPATSTRHLISNPSIARRREFRVPSGVSVGAGSSVGSGGCWLGWKGIFAEAPPLRFASVGKSGVLPSVEVILVGN